jgi:hypothetical protein
MSVPTTAVARHQPVLSDVERMTTLGFLAAYHGYTRDYSSSKLAPSDISVDRGLTVRERVDSGAPNAPIIVAPRREWGPSGRGRRGVVAIDEVVS